MKPSKGKWTTHTTVHTAPGHNTFKFTAKHLHSQGQEKLHVNTNQHHKHLHLSKRPSISIIFQYNTRQLTLKHTHKQTKQPHSQPRGATTELCHTTTTTPTSAIRESQHAPSHSHYPPNRSESKRPSRKKRTRRDAPPVTEPLTLLLPRSSKSKNNQAVVQHSS